MGHAATGDKKTNVKTDLYADRDRIRLETVPQDEIDG